MLEELDITSLINANSSIYTMHACISTHNKYMLQSAIYVIYTYIMYIYICGCSYCIWPHEDCKDASTW